MLFAIKPRAEVAGDPKFDMTHAKIDIEYKKDGVSLSGGTRGYYLLVRTVKREAHEYTGGIYYTESFRIWSPACPSKSILLAECKRRSVGAWNESLGMLRNDREHAEQTICDAIAPYEFAEQTPAEVLRAVLFEPVVEVK